MEFIPCNKKYIRYNKCKFVLYDNYSKCGVEDDYGIADGLGNYIYTFDEEMNYKNIDKILEKWKYGLVFNHYCFKHYKLWKFI